MTNKFKQKIQILVSLLLITFFALACVGKVDMAVNNPQGYDLTKPTKYSMPDILQEISGIAFNKGDNSFVYAQQDEDGRLFRLPIGKKEHQDTKFAGKGDYEDVAILNNRAILLKSNGNLFSFPLFTEMEAQATSVKVSSGLVPKGEYEGMYADEATGLVYLLCKSCKIDSESNSTSGYILASNNDGTFKASGTFKVDASRIDNLSGKKKGKFHPSALAKHPLTSEWYIVSSVNKALVILDSKWQVKNVHHLSANMFNQPEGIAFDSKGNLYISNEGSETQLGDILKFEYNPSIKK